MFIHTLESLEEFEDYIDQLEETVGLTTDTYHEIKNKISEERTKLKKSENKNDLIIYDVPDKELKTMNSNEDNYEWGVKNIGE